MWKTLAYNKAVPEPKAPESTDPGVSEVAPKDVPETVVGRLQKVLEYLNSIANHAAVTVPQIYQKTGIDLASPGEYEVCDRVRNNPKVRIEGDKIAYKAKFDIKSRNDVLRQLNRSPEGIPFRDLKDCYKNVEDDLRDLTRIGTVICIRNTEDGNDVYYPRGAQFLVELSGTGLVEHGCYMVATKEDITNEVRRGDAVKVGDHWFRVSAAPKVRLWQRCRCNVHSILHEAAWLMCFIHVLRLNLMSTCFCLCFIRITMREPDWRRQLPAANVYGWDGVQERIVRARFEFVGHQENTLPFEL
ncbi:hypothetical protein, variant [Aphanomyces invadans]|uniref:TFA2 Winged helix domain-containing protein n=1 Tax=Aphanomyces invadans TaxID=157072 RepID=A0A024TJU1_9STRA|nr:hypothetical protein, variant [Aphanomyces invadans]ETV93627.1 hypothetical protein, variant [Aphanomyces invadans]|eukprot:XP_008877667.1 hypothetical protein, variant [Aphanomyces invadans]